MKISKEFLKEDDFMKVKEKLMLDNPGLVAHGPINIVIFGDSVSHGALNGNFDYENVYWNILKKKVLFHPMQIVIFICLTVSVL